jgi:two-component system cell cycle response regulator DivK
MSLVLIIEDNPLNMKLARDILEAKGYTVATADSGEDGVLVAIEKLPDLVLMDIQLPGIDGVESLARLRAEPSTAAIPVVAFTASVTAGDRSRVSEAGFDGFVSKPIDLKEFVATIKRFAGDSGA